MRSRLSEVEAEGEAARSQASSLGHKVHALESRLEVRLLIDLLLP